MVLLDKQDYINKVDDLLAQRETYSPLVADPTNKHKTNSPTHLGLVMHRED